MTLRVTTSKADAERPGLHSHAERGNNQQNFSILGEKVPGPMALLTALFQPPPIPCGSWLACESGVSVDIFVDCAAVFAAMRRPDKPAP
ncbi:hypothetical protein ACW9H3_30140, partial [Pseudomonas sp. SDO5222_S391]